MGPPSRAGVFLSALAVCLLNLFIHGRHASAAELYNLYCVTGDKTTVWDKELAQVMLNVEFLAAEHFLWATVGHGLEEEAPDLVGGGPPPIGAQMGRPGPLLNDTFYQMGLQQVGHIRAIKAALGGCAFPRPALDISKKTWADIMDNAFVQTFGQKLEPPFDPYDDAPKFLISAYCLPYVAMTGYVGAILDLEGDNSKELFAGLLAEKAGQDAAIRFEMYRMKDRAVAPYDYTVADFSNAISNLRSNLSRAWVDEGVVVGEARGAEMKVAGNILAGDENSLAYGRTPAQVLATAYGTGSASQPGAFFPNGTHGVIAATYLAHN